MDKFQYIYAIEKEINQRLKKGSVITNETDQITSLYLDYLQIKIFPMSILDIRSLFALSLAGNFLESIPPEIVNLRKLVRLNLLGNLLTKIPDEVGEMDQLRVLNIAQNRLTEIPESIADLKNLRELQLRKNSLRSVPYRYSELKNLLLFDLGFNELTSIPPEYKEFEIPFEWDYDYEDTGIYLEGNPLINPPATAIMKDGDKAVRYYLENSHATAIANKEIKCCIIGPQGSGKTSFIRRLFSDTFTNLEAPTAGIEFSNID